MQSFAEVINDDRIGEVVIVDDCSTDGSGELLLESTMGIGKVKLYRNETNLDCYRNKAIAISLATNEYAILLDSDNVIGTDYLDAIYSQQWSPDVILNPVFARPHFSFTHLSGVTVNKGNIAKLMQHPMTGTMLNAMNYFVHCASYLKVWDGSVDPHTSDSIYQNYNWLNSGRSIMVVPGVSYQHLVHSGSHYKLNNHKAKDFHKEVEAKIMLLR